METDESGVSLPSGPDGRKLRVSYFYELEPTIGDYYYGQGHPMKPHRICMAHSLIVHYNLHRRFEISRPSLADASDIGQFHSPDYVDFLRSVSPESMADHSSARSLRRFNVGEDCPVFDGLFDFFRSISLESMGDHSSARSLRRFNVEEDCPVFDGLFDFRSVSPDCHVLT